MADAHTKLGSLVADHASVLYVSVLMQMRLDEIPRALFKCSTVFASGLSATSRCQDVSGGLELSRLDATHLSAHAPRSVLRSDSKVEVPWQQLQRRAVAIAGQRVLDTLPAQLSTFAAALASAGFREDHPIVVVCAQTLTAAVQGLPFFSRASSKDETALLSMPAGTPACSVHVFTSGLESMTCKELSRLAKDLAWCGIATGPAVEYMAGLAYVQATSEKGGADGICKLCDAALQFALAGATVLYVAIRLSQATCPSSCIPRPHQSCVLLCNLSCWI
jgi:hypothetical protein